MDRTTAVNAIHRELRDADRDGRPARLIVGERQYAAAAADVWDALTNPERIPRWLMPITGELRVGGRYQLEGNAGGTITVCEPPEHLAVTWEYDAAVSWVDVYLTGSAEGTTLRLEHVALVEDFPDKWDEFGPGAVGVGWDLSLLGLAEHLATGGDVNADLGDPAGVELIRRSSDGWRQASVDYGTPVEQAEAAAARTTAAYTGG